MKKFRFLLIFILVIISFCGCSRGVSYNPIDYGFNFAFVPACSENGVCNDTFHSYDTFLINETYHCKILQNRDYSTIKLAIVPNDEYFVITNRKERYKDNYKLYHYDFEITFLKYTQTEPLTIEVIWQKTGEVYYTFDVYVR